MARWRQPGASELLWVFLALNVVAFAVIVVWNPVPGLTTPSWGLLVIVFCTWWVSQGGRIARIYLILSSGLAYGRIVLSVARSWDPAVPVLLLLFAAHVALLVSPPVFARTRPAPYPLRIGWTQLVRRPPSWLLPWALFSGVAVTVAYLANMHHVTFPGCTPTSSDACEVMGRGYPLRWLIGTNYGDSKIYTYTLFRDFVQWALTSASVLYLAWLWLTEPTGVRPARPAGATGAATTGAPSAGPTPEFLCADAPE